MSDNTTELDTETEIDPEKIKYYQGPGPLGIFEPNTIDCPRHGEQPEWNICFSNGGRTTTFKTCIDCARDKTKEILGDLIIETVEISNESQ